MPKITRYAYEVTRTVTYVDVIISEGEDEHQAKDAALEKVRSQRPLDVKTDGSGFKYLGHSDYAKKLNIFV